ncbi:hypothetical protein IW261DRAFT_1481063 [Armillaria novae-zelandiae]|uniref:DUF6533 domain-containing protein n=1 Tax=Armillaria novae-zelandiae TaxID=153914 RepID=A0AA39P7E2_9AGAR|nr:hypothetical protein IW261DRAFT_1481063 [Armillaria novae-zelandiae]
MSETATEIVLHVLLYDHLLTFPAEVDLIWAARWSVPKALFLLLRYIVPPSVIIHTHLLSGIANSHLSNTMYLGQISVAISNFLVLLHLWNLWERTPLFICCTLALFTLTTIANIVCTTIVVLATSHNVYFDHDLRTCAMRARDRMPLLWAPCMAFEVVAFSAMVYNALSRPRSLHTDVGKILYRDGIAYFLVTLRLMNLLLASVAPVSPLLWPVSAFIWSSTTVTVTRLILNLRELRIRTAKLQDESATTNLYN